MSVGNGVGELVCSGSGTVVGVFGLEVSTAVAVTGCVVLVGCKVGVAVGAELTVHPISSKASVAHRAVMEILGFRRVVIG